MRFRAINAILPVALQLSLAAGLVSPASAQPLTVDQAVAEAIRNNLSLMAERANIAIAEARVLTARLRPNPVLSATSDHLDLLGTGFDEINGGGPSEYSLRNDFVIERRGKRQGRIDVAQKAKNVAELAFLDGVRTKVLEVQNAFVDALLARDNLALARQNQDSLNQIVEINAVRVKAGDIAEVELIRSQVAALQFASSVRRAELVVRTSETRLKTLLARPAGSGPVEVSGELRKEADVAGLAELRASALGARPDLQALRLEAERAAAEVRLQALLAKPDYTLGAEYRRQQGVNGQGNSLGLFFSTPLPIFDRNQGEIARAGQEQKQIGLRVRALELAIAEEVENALNQFAAARGLLDTILGQLLTQAQEVREITEFSYRRGEATLLELLDAQRTFNETVQAYNEARAEHARSLYLLDAVCGKAVIQ